MAYKKISVPAGEKIEMKEGKLVVPDRPVIPFVEGDGTGPDITRAAHVALDAAVEAAYGDARKIAWMEVFAGEKANAVYLPNIWLPQETGRGKLAEATDSNLVFRSSYLLADEAVVPQTSKPGTIIQFARGSSRSRSAVLIVGVPVEVST